MINVKDYGLKNNDSTFDNTPVWNVLLTSLGDDKEIYFPAGVWYFKTKPAIIKTPLTVRGCGLNNTNLFRDYIESDLNSALIHTNNTLNLSNLAITAVAGTSGGGAVKLDGLPASGSILRDLYITGQQKGTWAIPVTLYSSDPLGIRTCHIDNLDIFAATIHLIWCVNVRGLTLNANCYPAGGTSNQVTIQHYDAQNRSANIQIETRYMDKLYLYNTDSLIIQSVVGTSIVQSGCTKIRSI